MYYASYRNSVGWNDFLLIKGNLSTTGSLTPEYMDYELSLVDSVVMHIQVRRVHILNIFHIRLGFMDIAMEKYLDWKDLKWYFVQYSL